MHHSTQLVEQVNSEIAAKQLTLALIGVYQRVDRKQGNKMQNRIHAKQKNSPEKEVVAETQVVRESPPPTSEAAIEKHLREREIDLHEHVDETLEHIDAELERALGWSAIQAA